MDVGHFLLIACVIVLFQMGMNPIGEPGVEAILKGITTNPTLRLVGLEVSIPLLYFTNTSNSNLI